MSEHHSHGTSTHGETCRCARCTGYEAGNVYARTHGATSEPTVKPLATIQKRRFLRQNGLRKADIDGVGLALLDVYARAQSKVELLDAWFSQHGLLEADGKPQPALGLYFRALNTATRTLKALNAHLKQRAETDPFETLNAHIVELRQAADDG
jgi:hypothetical protein